MKSISQRFNSGFNGIWISIFILVIILTFFYIKVYHKKWKATPASVELTISGMDSLYNIGKFSHLSLLVANHKLDLKDTLFNHFRLSLTPGTYIFLLVDNTSVLHTDTFVHEGIKMLHYTVRNVRYIKGKLKMETDIVNIWEL